MNFFSICKHTTNVHNVFSSHPGCTLFESWSRNEKNGLSLFLLLLLALILFYVGKNFQVRKLLVNIIALKVTLSFIGVSTLYTLKEEILAETKFGGFGKNSPN